MGLRREPFHPSPRRPDLFVPRHVWIHQALVLSRAPHSDEGGAEFLARRPVSRLCNGIRETLEHDERCGAGRMGCGKQCRGCERAGDCNEDGFKSQKHDEKLASLPLTWNAPELSESLAAQAITPAL